MKNKEENTKKNWQTPEVYDLDVEKTAGGPVTALYESTLPGIGAQS